MLRLGSESDLSEVSSFTGSGCAACYGGLSSATILFPFVILLLVEGPCRVQESDIGIGPNFDRSLRVSEFSPWRRLRDYFEGNSNRTTGKLTYS